jgi:hypothetical protein
VDRVEGSKSLEAALEQLRETAADFGAEVLIAPRRQIERYMKYLLTDFA